VLGGVEGRLRLDGLRISLLLLRCLARSERCIRRSGLTSHDLPIGGLWRSQRLVRLAPHENEGKRGVAARRPGGRIGVEEPDFSDRPATGGRDVADLHAHAASRARERGQGVPDDQGGEQGGTARMSRQSPSS